MTVRTPVEESLEEIKRFSVADLQSVEIDELVSESIENEYQEPSFEELRYISTDRISTKE